ncbi:MAG: glycosyltransferase family 39 protein [Lachnospiraceae bacterium]|nr:glycosyltransferase family 39 protein [Lachnospiraceae bacterium]
MQNKLKEIKPITYLIIAVFLFGSLIRLLGLSNYPAGLNQDEAFSGYEAYCLATTGADSFEYKNPVYLTVWGSGQSALNSYLIAPLIKIFGMKTFCIRLPQAIVGCMSLLAIYLLFKKLLDEKAGLIAMFILAVMPWHIMESRWGLDCNLAPEFLLFGLCFFVYGMEKPKYYIGSAIMYGLSLYSYATIWPIVPVILLIQIIYAAYYKKIQLDKYFIVSAGIVTLFALPLLLFLLVNKDIINEIKTPVISIPKLLYMRESEISFDNFFHKLQNLASIIWNQSDGLPWNATEPFGLFYNFSLLFAGIGLIYMIYIIIKNFRKKECNGTIFLLLNLLVAIFLGCLIEVNINRINSVFIPIIFCIIWGIIACGKLIWKYSIYFLVLLYFISFLKFGHYYVTDYNKEIGFYFQAGIQDAIKFATLQEGDIYINNVSYTKVLYCSQTDPKLYRQTVQYTNYPSAFLDVSSFDRFHFGYDINQITLDATYIIDISEKDAYQGLGFRIQEFQNFAVAY